MTESFDAIVIGSGLGGLTAGALYSRSGRRVLVLERNPTFGGAATVYRHNSLAIEASLHELDGLDDDDPKLPLLRSLGLDRDLQFIPLRDRPEIRGPIVGAPFAMPCGVQAALDAAAARFPQHKTALKSYFDRLAAARGAASFASRHMDDSSLWWLSHAPQSAQRLWPLIREGQASVSEALQDLFGADESVKAALAGNLLYWDDDPDRMLFLRYAIPQASFLIGGGHYLRGGSQALSDRLVALIREAGGVVESGREADAILLRGGKVAAVRHCAAAAGGARTDVARTDVAPVVFGNAAPQALAEMLPEDRRAGFLAPYAGRPQSISLWTVALGFNRPPRDFGVMHHSTVILPAWMQRLSQLRDGAAIMGGEPGERIPPYAFADFGRIDHGLDDGGGLSLGELVGADRLENWAALGREAQRARKERWMDRIIADLDREFPGIAGAVAYREMATAQTMQRHLNTPGGVVYGFAPTGLKSIKFEPCTTIDGLWLASAYTGYGGFTGAMLGGAAAAHDALRQAEQARHSLPDPRGLPP